MDADDEEPDIVGIVAEDDGETGDCKTAFVVTGYTIGKEQMLQARQGGGPARSLAVIIAAVQLVTQ